jgi:hypothetical protein
MVAESMPEGVQTNEGRLPDAGKRP